MTISVTAEGVRRAGFPMGGEPLVALDLADTVLLQPGPPVDLLEDPGRAGAWWDLQAPRLPSGPAPVPVATRRLRTAVRDVLDAHVEDRPAGPRALVDLNATASSVPTSPRLEATGDELVTGTRWHTEHGGNAALAAIAREVIALLGDPARLALLRRCANPECSMLFLAENRRRRWCRPGACGNRTRVARHKARHRPVPGDGLSGGSIRRTVEEER